MTFLRRILCHGLPLGAALVLGASGASAIPLLNGLNGPAGYGTNRLENNDDGSSAAIPITTAFGTRGPNFFGSYYTTMYVNNNGNITFNGAVSTYTPNPFPIASQPMIAPWWGDVDTRPAATGLPQAPTNYGVYYVVEAGRVIVTWHNVGYYSSGYGRLNDFQLILTDRSQTSVAGDFDVEFRYNRCEWVAGTASGGDANGQCVVGNTACTPAQAGFDAGDQRNFETLPNSRTNQIVNLCTTSNAGTPGLWRFQVRGGGVQECGNGTRELGEACDDGNTRAGDGCSATCQVELPNGQTCNSGDQCQSGFCADGVCCGSRCDGQCEVCNATGSAGTCTAVTGAPRGGRMACAGGTSVCAGTCNGTNRTACTYPGSTTSCGAASCTSGTATGQAGCNGSGACNAGAVTMCAPYVCGSTACRTSCATDDDCATGNYCNTAMQCVPKRPNGGTCSATRECSSGNCVDGVCCNTGCNGQCEACNLDGSVGTCTAATGVPRGMRAACTGAGTSCGGSCNGTNRTACVYPPSTTSCRAAACMNGTATLPATCDGMGTCPATSEVPCAPYACGETACRTSCTTNDDCSMGNICQNGMCTGRRPNGGMCQTAGECESGNCIDGVCCNTACNGQCEACDVAGSVGTCSAVTGAVHGMRTACTGTGPCASTCNGTDRMACTFPGSSTSCRAASCADGSSTAAASCDGMGACPAAMTTGCNGYTCNDTACRTSCSDNAQCATGYVCTNGMCVMPTADAGVTDAGTSDAGNADGGVADAGATDAGNADGGGVMDSGIMKGADAGPTRVTSLQGDGCGCRVPGGTGTGRAPMGALFAAAAVGLVVRRRRR